VKLLLVGSIVCSSFVVDVDYNVKGTVVLILKLMVMLWSKTFLVVKVKVYMQ
jgi:hypothetical protein